MYWFWDYGIPCFNHLIIGSGTALFGSVLIQLLLIFFCFKYEHCKYQSLTWYQSYEAPVQQRSDWGREKQHKEPVGDAAVQGAC